MKEDRELQTNAKKAEKGQKLQSDVDSGVNTTSSQGVKSGEEFKEESSEQVPLGPNQKKKVPLFLRTSSDAPKGTAQDEKDEMEE